MPKISAQTLNGPSRQLAWSRFALFNCFDIQENTASWADVWRLPDSEPSNKKMGQKRKLEVRRFVRANLSAGIATWVEWLLVTVLVAIKLHYLVALAIGATIGAATDFTIKRNWAFIRNKTGMIQKEAIRYVIAAAASLGLNLVLAYALVDGLGMMKIPGVITASIVVGILWNYPVHRFFVFRARGATSPAAS